AGAWFFLILGPSSSVVPIVTEIAAERRFYLPLLAVVALTVVGVEALRRRFLARTPERGAKRRQDRQPHWARAAAVVLACTLLTAATHARSRVYRDPEALW